MIRLMQEAAHLKECRTVATSHRSPGGGGGGGGGGGVCVDAEEDSPPEGVQGGINCFTIVPQQHVLEGLSKEGQLEGDLVLVGLIIV